MKLLLDTHALLWWMSDDQRLGPGARALIANPDNAVLVSVVSLWEIVIKLRIGKLKADIGQIERATIRYGFDRLSIMPAHLATLATLPQHHRDPFDHLLLAQAITETTVFVSDNEAMSRYAVDLQRCRAI